MKMKLKREESGKLTQGLFCRDPSRRVSTDHFSEEILGGGGDSPEDSRREAKVSPNHSLKDLSSRVSIKRRNPSQHYVQNNTTAPHINFLIIFPSHHNLRRHVVRRPHHATHAASVAEPLRRSEVRQLQIIRRVEENIVGLDVAVGHAQAVAVRDGFQKALDEEGGLGLGDWAVNDAVEEGVGLAEVHDDGEIIVVLEDIEDLEDVGVRAEEGHEFWFVLEALAVG